MNSLLPKREPPKELAARKIWLLWKFEPKTGDKKPTKIPYYANGKRRSGSLDSENDRAQLVDYKAAFKAAQKLETGIGFTICDGITGIDLDNVIDEIGCIDQSASQLISVLNSYTEYSPSGKGIHIIAFAKILNFQNISANIEVYSSKRFFTFTGKRYHA